jgi:hypothetical protein
MEIRDLGNLSIFFLKIQSKALYLGEIIKFEKYENRWQTK